ncbi:hypothetical protein PE066_03690 [Ramlibacter tataouinensis]|uniref:hypothetical protein n=1 Tax=Ramlibacter tataouinensis TaxID=94132 RepID=UPI0022F3BB5D|nr:hypothetical protein [Ramlibacter tataouinensis]WBY02653.1 hypothetical protein PE066_03690 [Ramlibacter tataouinensis]
MNRDEQQRMGTADLVAGAEQQDRQAWGERQPPEAADRVRQAQQAQQAPRPGGGATPQQMEQRQPMDRPASAHTQPQHGQSRHEPVQHGQPPRGEGMQGTDQLAALFPPQVAADFRQRWDQVQIGFVDDPRRAVQHADELVAQVMKSLAATFAEQRTKIESSLGRGEQADTEDLRVALRGYRSFFQRLLSL